MVMRPQYPSIPAITPEGLSPIQRQTQDAFKENIELLTGQRGDDTTTAITRGQITVRPLPETDVKRVTATGGGWTIQRAGQGDIEVPRHSDYILALIDLQKVIIGYNTLHDAFNNLVSQLKGQG